MPYASQRDLRGKHPGDTFPYLVSVDSTGSLFDGTGSQVTRVNVTCSFAETASIQTSWEESSSFASMSFWSTSASFASNSIWSTSSSFASSSLSASHVSGSSVIVQEMTASVATIGGYSLGVPIDTTIQIGRGLNKTSNNAFSIQIGYRVGQFSTVANSAIQIGYFAGNNTSIASSSVQIGASAGSSCMFAGNAVQIGGSVGVNSVTASKVVQIGFSAGFDAADARNSVQIGHDVAREAYTSSNAVQIGFESGYNGEDSRNVVYVGYQSGKNARSSSFSTFIGSNTDATQSLLEVTKSIAIGYNAKVSGSNMCVIGGLGVDAVKVGIGTGAPTKELEVVGDISASVVSSSIYAPSAIVIPTGTLPTTPTTGSMTYDLAGKFLYIYNGTTWDTGSFV